MMKLHVERHADGGIDIRLGFGLDQLRPVVKTLCRDGVSVGLNAAQIPLFVRIRDAQGIDAVFSAVAESAAQNTEPSREQLIHIVKHCQDLAATLSMAYHARQVEDTEIKYELTTA